MPVEKHLPSTEHPPKSHCKLPFFRVSLQPYSVQHEQAVRRFLLGSASVHWPWRTRPVKDLATELRVWQSQRLRQRLKRPPAWKCQLRLYPSTFRQAFSQGAQFEIERVLRCIENHDFDHDLLLRTCIAG